MNGSGLGTGTTKGERPVLERHGLTRAARVLGHKQRTVNNFDVLGLTN